MSDLRSILSGFLFAIGVALAFILMHALNISPGVCR